MKSFTRKSLVVLFALGAMSLSSAFAAPLSLTNCKVDSVKASTVNFGTLQVSQCDKMFGQDAWVLEVTRKSAEGITGVRDLAATAITYGLRVDVEGDKKGSEGFVDSVTLKSNPLQF